MLINEGKYQAKVTAAVLTEAGQDKKPVIEITAELTGNGLNEPVSLSKTFWLGEQKDEYDEQGRAEWVVSLERLRKIGFTGDDIAQLDSCVGFVGVAGVKTKTGRNGQPYSVMSWIDRASTAKPMEAAKARNFADEMKARIRAVEGSNRPAPAPRAAAQRPQARPAAQPEFTAPDDSEIPF